MMIWSRLPFAPPIVACETPTGHIVHFLALYLRSLSRGRFHNGLDFRVTVRSVMYLELRPEQNNISLVAVQPNSVTHPPRSSHLMP
jgi:hypothetical protein